MGYFNPKEWEYYYSLKPMLLGIYKIWGLRYLLNYIGMKPQATGEAPGAELEILIKLHRYGKRGLRKYT